MTEIFEIDGSRAQTITFSNLELGNSFNLVSHSNIPYISSAMKSFSRHTFVILALLSYLIGNALVDLTHHDETNVLLHSQPALSSHECGAKEIHVPLDTARHCLACSQFAQRISTDVNRSYAADASIVCVALLPSQSERIIEIDIISSGKRGPPHAFA